MTKIMEDLAEWQQTYESGWLAHYRATGEMDWKRYNRPRNEAAPAGPGINLARSRLTLVTSAGSYLKGEQEPFVTQRAQQAPANHVGMAKRVHVV